MVDIHSWMDAYQTARLDLFGGRVLLIGLQGSYARGEAREDSDIDVVLILDTVSFKDLKRYREALDALACRPLICGFVSGRREITGWCKADLFQFYHDTVALYGDLDALIPPFNATDVRAAVLAGACGLYHAASHMVLHHFDVQELRGLFKQAFFVLQARCFQTSGKYLKNRVVLEKALSGRDLDMLRSCTRMREAPVSPEEAEPLAKQLLQWTGELIGGQ